MCKFPTMFKMCSLFLFFKMSGAKGRMRSKKMRNQPTNVTFSQCRDDKGWLKSSKTQLSYLFCLCYTCFLRTLTETHNFRSEFWFSAAEHDGSARAQQRPDRRASGYTWAGTAQVHRWLGYEMISLLSAYIGAFHFSQIPLISVYQPCLSLLFFLQHHSSPKHGLQKSMPCWGLSRRPQAAPMYLELYQSTCAEEPWATTPRDCLVG